MANLNEESKTYQVMLKDLESIVRRLGEGEIDLDIMVEEVEKGYELIRVMQTRLESTKAKIDLLQQRFEAGAAPSRE